MGTGTQGNEATHESAGTPVARGTAASTTGGGPLTAPYALTTVALLALITIIAFEAMAISTAMPRAAQELGAIRSYGLTFSVMLTTQLLGIVVSGVWSDRSGPLPALFAGQALMALGSAGCAVAPTFGPFLAGRAVAGLGAGLIVVALYVVVGRAYPESLRPKVFAYASAAWVLPALVGAPIAAGLTTWLSWRAVFWVVVLPIVATIVIVWTRRARLSPAGEGRPSSRDHHAHVRAAWAGLLIAAGAGLLQWGTENLVVEWSARTVLALVGLVGVGVAAPLLVPRGTWRMARGLPSVMVSRSLMTAAFFGSLTFVPLMLVNERGLSIGEAGVVLAIGSLGWSAGSWLQGRDVMTGRRDQLVSAGGLSLMMGLLLLAGIAWFGWHPYLCGIGLVLGGLGMGCAMSSLSVLSLDLSPVEDHGATSSSLQLADVLGSVMGIAAASAWFAARHDPSGPDHGVYTTIWLVLAGVAALAILGGRRIRT